MKFWSYKGPISSRLLVSIYIFLFIHVLYPVFSKKSKSKSKFKKLNNKNQNKYSKKQSDNNISVQPNYFFSNHSKDPRYPSLSYHMVSEDNSSKPIIRYPYKDPYAVEMRPNRNGFLVQQVPALN